VDRNGLGSMTREERHTARRGLGHAGLEPSSALVKHPTAASLTAREAVRYRVRPTGQYMKCESDAAEVDNLRSNEGTR
jgi:hypothetical protein